MFQFIVAFLGTLPLVLPGVPEKNITDLNNSNGNCLILVSKQLFLLKSTILE